MAGQDKRVIEQQATSEVFADDWFLKDSVTEGTTKISSENLKAWINDGMATKGDIETVVKNIADTYSESESYAEGDLCIHEYALFKCTGTTTGTWDSTKWQATTVAELLDSIDLSAEAISYDNTASGLEADNVQDAIDEVLSALKIVRDIPNTPTAIATFTDGSDLPMPKLEVGIEPVQDLHGYDHPWVGGSGKNKLPPIPYPYEAKVLVDYGHDVTLNGYTFSFIFSGSFVNGGASFIVLQDGNGSSISAIAIQSYKKVSDNTNIVANTTYSNEKIYFSSSTSITFRKIALYAYPNFTNAKFENAQLESGTTVTTYEPYSNTCPIIGWDEVNVSVSGVNVWDEEWEQGVISITTGQNVSGNGIRSKNYSNCKGNTSYYFSVGQTADYIMWYDKDKNFINHTYADSSKVVTSPSNAYYFKIRIDSISTYSNNVSVNYPSTDTEYHAYNGHTYTIQLGQTVYGGKVDLVNGTMLVTKAIKVFNGEETWGYINGFFFANVLSPNGKNNAPSMTSNGINVAIVNNNQVRVYLEFNPSITADTDMNEIFNSGSQVVYELATPLTIQLPTTVVKSLRGVNNISADSGDVLDGKYIADASLTIASLDARITALENQ